MARLSHPGLLIFVPVAGVAFTIPPLLLPPNVGSSIKGSLGQASSPCFMTRHSEGRGESSQEQETGVMGISRWVRPLSRVVALAFPAVLPLVGIMPPRAANAVGEGIVRALQEDPSKKYIDEGADLVETLKRRSIANKAKNDRERMEKTFLNSEAGIFGPFDKFIPVMTKEGKYVLLLEEEYNKLRDEGKIVGRDLVVDYDVPADAGVQIGKENKKEEKAEKAPEVAIDQTADDADLADDEI